MFSCIYVLLLRHALLHRVWSECRSRGRCRGRSRSPIKQTLRQNRQNRRLAEKVRRGKNLQARLLAKRMKLKRQIKKSDDSREPGEELYECERCGNDAAGVIQCERCMKWCCGSCQNVTLEMIEALDRWPNLHWFCTVCDPIAMEAVCTSMTGGKISHAGALEKRVDKMLEGVAKQLGDIIQDGKDRIKESCAEAVKVIENRMVSLTENSQSVNKTYADALKSFDDKLTNLANASEGSDRPIPVEVVYN